MTQGVIYALIDPRTEEIRYVGQTTQSAEGRRKSHVYGAKRGKTHCAKWIRSVLDDGAEPIVIVLSRLPWEFLDEAERFWIVQLRKQGCKLTNHESGGNARKTFSVDAKTRAKISKSLKGKSKSEFTKEKMRAAQRKPRSSRSLESSRNAMIRVNRSRRGVSHSELHNERIGKSNRRITQRFRWSCNECSIVALGGSVARHQKVSGHAGMTRVEMD